VGYVGVDVFFVISGFLITSNILRDQAGRRFSPRVTAKFYSRRIRPFLPRHSRSRLAVVPSRGEGYSSRAGDMARLAESALFAVGQSTLDTAVLAGDRLLRRRRRFYVEPLAAHLGRWRWRAIPILLWARRYRWRGLTTPCRRYCYGRRTGRSSRRSSAPSCYRTVDPGRGVLPDAVPDGSSCHQAPLLAVMTPQATRDHLLRRSRQSSALLRARLTSSTTFSMPRPARTLYGPSCPCDRTGLGLHHGGATAGFFSDRLLSNRVCRKCGRDLLLALYRRSLAWESRFYQHLQGRSRVHGPQTADCLCMSWRSLLPCHWLIERPLRSGG
jgi:hypothetical protein